MRCEHCQWFTRCVRPTRPAGATGSGALTRRPPDSQSSSSASKPPESWWPANGCVIVQCSQERGTHDHDSRPVGWGVAELGHHDDRDVADLSRPGRRRAGPLLPSATGPCTATRMRDEIAGDHQDPAPAARTSAPGHGAVADHGPRPRRDHQDRMGTTQRMML